jgi:cysteine desulfurase
MRKVYLDYAATTPVDERVVEAMLPYLKEHFGNPSSVHEFGRIARDAIESSRRKLAELLDAHPSEIVFTGSGTEADNLAIRGFAYTHRDKGNHIITSKVEHSAVLNTCRALEKEGFEVTYLDVDEKGNIDLTQLENSITSKTILITIMTVNNELGTIYPIREIGEIARKRGIVFHSDALQGFGKMPMSMKELPVDMISMGAHKIYGPKGVGALYVRRGVRIQKILHGGHQERDRRPGTENVAGIVGFVKAAEICIENMQEESSEIGKLRDYFQERIFQEIEDVALNGDPEHRLFPFLNISFKNVEGESLLLALDVKGIAASAGSACSSGAVEPSHVLKAIDPSEERALTSIRFSLGRFTSKEDIDYVVDEMKPIIQRLRALSNY